MPWFIRTISWWIWWFEFKINHRLGILKKKIKMHWSDNCLSMYIQTGVLVSQQTCIWFTYSNNSVYIYTDKYMSEGSERGHKRALNSMLSAREFKGPRVRQSALMRGGLDEGKLRTISNHPLFCIYTSHLYISLHCSLSLYSL